MNEQVQRPRGPFLFAAAIVAIVTTGLFRLPQLFVAGLERNSPFTQQQSGWAFRLLFFAALFQAAYGGFSVLSTERIRRHRESDPRVAAMPRARIARSLAGTAAFMIILAIVYGLASFAVSGERGGYWLFFGLAVAQEAWYYRRVGEVVEWLRFQPETMTDTSRPTTPWEREPPDYVPPLVRGLVATGDPTSG